MKDKQDAEPTTDEATSSLQGEVGKAVVRGALAEVQRRVEAAADGLLSAAEKHLEERQAALAAGDPDPDEPEDDDEGEDDEDTVLDMESPLHQPATPTDTPPEDEGGDEDDAGEPSPDLMDAARAVLRKAAEARGTTYEEPAPAPRAPEPQDPLAAAQAVLDRAAQARQLASKGRHGVAREQRARDELAKLKAQLKGTSPDDDSSEPSPKRSL